MLAEKSYPADYVAHCRALVDDHLAAYDALTLEPAQRSAFERGYVQHLTLSLDNLFTHRMRGAEGKDGNPINEVRMLCASIKAHGGVLTADSTIKYSADTSVLGLAVGDEIDVDVAAFRRLATAFLDEIEKRFPPA